MWSLVDVVRDVGPEHPLEVPTIVDQDVVEALPAHSPHEPFRVGVVVSLRLLAVPAVRGGSSSPTRSIP